MPVEGLHYTLNFVGGKKEIRTADTTELKIFYTTDGTTPDTICQFYTSPITLTRTTTLKVIAVIDGDSNWFNECKEKYC